MRTSPCASAWPLPHVFMPVQKAECLRTTCPITLQNALWMSVPSMPLALSCNTVSCARAMLHSRRRLISPLQDEDSPDVSGDRDGGEPGTSGRINGEGGPGGTAGRGGVEEGSEHESGSDDDSDSSDADDGTGRGKRKKKKQGAGRITGRKEQKVGESVGVARDSDCSSMSQRQVISSFCVHPQKQQTASFFSDLF